jgi:hypothetical protein
MVASCNVARKEKDGHVLCALLAYHKILTLDHPNSGGKLNGQAHL